MDRRLFKEDTDVKTVLKLSQCEVPDPRALVADYPDSLWTILKRGLARDLAARYQTTAEMSRDLYTFAASTGQNVGPTMLADVMREVCARGQWLR